MDYNRELSETRMQKELHPGQTALFILEEKEYNKTGISDCLSK